MILSSRGQPLIDTPTILDMLKARYGSDYKAAKALGVPPSYISNWRGRHIVLKDEIGLKAAELLDFPEDAILLSLAAERALNSPVWEKIARVAQAHTPEQLPPTEAPAPEKPRKKAG